MPLFKKKYHKYTDEDLIGLVAKGDETAFDELYERYAQKLYHFFYKMLYQNKAIAADFTQTLFIKAFEKASYYDSTYKFSTWLYTLASNMCKNEYRRISRTTQTINLEESIKTVEPQAPITIDMALFNNDLQLAINRLDKKHRLVFVMRYQEHKSIKELSEILDCPQGTVKSRLHHALKKLSKDLERFRPYQKKIKG